MAFKNLPEQEIDALPSWLRMVRRVYCRLSTSFSYIYIVASANLPGLRDRLLGGLREHDCIRQVMYVHYLVVVNKDTPPIVAITMGI